MRIGFAAALRGLPLLPALFVVACGGGGGSTSTVSGPSAASVCARIPTKAVARLVARASAGPAPALRRSAGGSSQLLKCAFAANGVHVDLNLDLAANSRQRFDNRITEMTQFSTGRPATFPRPVRGIGDPSFGDAGAQWIPALDQLLAYRPGRYVIVDFSAANAADAANRDGAAALARIAFPLLPRSSHPLAQRPTPG